VDGFLPKVIIWTRGYAPKYEAVSKEILLLSNALRHVLIYNLSSRAELYFGARVISCYSRFYPSRIIIPVLEHRFDISHIFTSAPEHFYTSVLTKKPIILTYCGHIYLPSKNVSRFVQKLKKFDHVILESAKDFSALTSIGFETNKLSIIYPGIDLSKFKPSEPSVEIFKILFASSPLSDRDSSFYSRGVKLMLDSLDNIDGVRFVFLWRKGCSELLRTLMNRQKLNQSNVTIVNRIVNDITPFLTNVHAVIAPFTSIWAKACPHSIIEALASGKPVLVSTKVGISDLVKNEKCGVVFEPTAEGLVQAIEELRDHYWLYQNKSRRVAEKYFSKETFVENYRSIYESVYTS